jgi:glycosyltransferase involved in cell wall biosynthesis
MSVITNTPLISIVIPCFNAEKYIFSTLDSILNQRYINIEIIIIDDGSTDNSRDIISLFKDDRLKCYFQSNKGVSAARNEGMKKIKGEYVIFFDSDDIMSPDFLFSRIQIFQENNEVDFVCGEVVKFDYNGLKHGQFRGTNKKDCEIEILLYDTKVITCPSNYMFKSFFIKKNSVFFNEKLSSTADRFFILQCNCIGEALFTKKAAPLYYRVSPNSMSNLLNKKLVIDNERFYQELIKTLLIPTNINKKVLAKGYYILFKSFWKVGVKTKSIEYFFKWLLILLKNFISTNFFEIN